MILKTTTTLQALLYAHSNKLLHVVAVIIRVLTE
jgi:hypothetical protein